MEPSTSEKQEIATWNRERSEEELASFVSRLDDARFSDIEL
jgi:hypothetical protein